MSSKKIAVLVGSLRKESLNRKMADVLMQLAPKTLELKIVEIRLLLLVARGKLVASRIEEGMMFINSIDWSDAELPFGGIKNSGYGRDLGDMGIHQFENKKLVRVSSAHAPTS